MVRNGVQWHAFRGRLSPGPFFGTLSRTLFAQAAKGSSFLSHGRKKRSKESPPAARISVKMEHIRLKRKNSELRSSNSLRFFTPSVLHFLNLKSMRPELGLSYNFASLVGRLRFARWATSLRSLGDFASLVGRLRFAGRYPLGGCSFVLTSLYHCSPFATGAMSERR